MPGIASRSKICVKENTVPASVRADDGGHRNNQKILPRISGEEKLLTSPAAPIVLLKRLDGKIDIAPEVAPNLKYWRDAALYARPSSADARNECPLIMTSGNLSEEPIVCDNEEAQRKLGGIAVISSPQPGHRCRTMTPSPC